MANFTADVQLFGQDSFTSSTTQMHPLGTRGYTADGRRFRYARGLPSADPVSTFLVPSPDSLGEGNPDPRALAFVRPERHQARWA